MTEQVKFKERHRGLNDEGTVAAQVAEGMTDREKSAQWDSRSHFSEELDVAERAALAALLFRKGLLASQKNGQQG